VTKRLRLDPRDAGSRVSDSPPPEVYRFDGTETKGTDVTMAAGEAWRRFTLTLHRQLSSINGSGQIWVMQHPPNNTRHTYVYRRDGFAAR
jgi:hypothetical protein